MTANECYRPSLDAQLRYMVQWFHEWSEMQRGDFLPILAQKLAPGSYVNGLLTGMEQLGCEGRPPSLFQCRVKLFREWFETWGQTERDGLLGQIRSIDPDFYNKVQEELETVNSRSHNGVDADSPIEDSDAGQQLEEDNEMNDHNINSTSSFEQHANGELESATDE